MEYGYIVVLRHGIVIACAEIDDDNHNVVKGLMGGLYPGCEVETTFLPIDIGGKLLSE